MFRRHLMFMAIVVSILFLIGISISMRAEEQSLWNCSPKKIRSQQEFATFCMDLWMKINLVQAINKNEKLRQGVLKELERGVWKLYRITKKMERKIRRNRTNCVQIDPLKLVVSIKDAIETVFNETKSKHLTSTIEILNRMLEELIAPVDVDAYVTA